MLGWSLRFISKATELMQFGKRGLHYNSCTEIRFLTVPHYLKVKFIFVRNYVNIIQKNGCNNKYI